MADSLEKHITFVTTEINVKVTGDKPETTSQKATSLTIDNEPTRLLGQTTPLPI